jgi:hypothetical protein
MAAYFPKVLCKFGMTERKAMAILVGFNEKGGMDDRHSTWQTAGNVGAADLCNRDSDVRRQIQSFSRILEEEIG